MKALLKALVLGLVVLFATSTLGVAAVPSRAPTASNNYDPDFYIKSVMESLKTDPGFKLRIPKLIEETRQMALNSPRPKEGFIVIGPSKVFEKMREHRERREMALEAGREKFLSDNIRLQQASMGLYPARSAAPAFSRNFMLSRDWGLPIQTEPSICSSPEDRNNAVATWIDYGLAYNPVVVTGDGGETWRGPLRVPITPHTYSAGDPVLACGREKKVAQAFMALGDWNYALLRMPISITRSDIAVSGSADNGLSWRQPARVATNLMLVDKMQITTKSGKEVTVPIVGVSFLDKPWVAVGPNPQDPSRDSIYVTFTIFADFFLVADLFDSGLIILREAFSLSWIQGAASHDGGKTWVHTEVSPRRVAFDIENVPFPLGEIVFPAVQGSQPKVSKNGTVYYTWYDSGNDGFSRGKFDLFVAKSTDGGKTISKPVAAATGLIEPQWQPRSSSFRNIGSRLPHLEVGPDGEVYIVVIAKTESKPEDDGDVFFIRGKDADGALTFEAPKKVNQDEGSALQFFPAIAVGDKGEIHLSWGDTRRYPEALRYDIFYTRSLDKGETWGFEDKERDIREPDLRVTDFYSNPEKGFRAGLFIGDYLGIAAGADGCAYLVWPDTRLAEYGGANQKIGFARCGSIRDPEVTLKPSRGPAGQKVQVTALGFQPEMNVFVKLNDSIAFVGRTNDDGKAETLITIPIQSEGDQEVVAYDESGNFAQANYPVDVGFNNLASAKDVEKSQQDTAAAVEKSQQDTAAALEASNSLLKSKLDTVMKLVIGVLGTLSALILAAVLYAAWRGIRRWRTRRRTRLTS